MRGRISTALDQMLAESRSSVSAQRWLFKRGCTYTRRPWITLLLTLCRTLFCRIQRSHTSGSCIRHILENQKIIHTDCNLDTFHPVEEPLVLRFLLLCSSLLTSEMKFLNVQLVSEAAACLRMGLGLCPLEHAVATSPTEICLCASFSISNSTIPFHSMAHVLLRESCPVLSNSPSCSFRRHMRRISPSLSKTFL